MTTSTKPERLAAALKARNLDVTLTAKLPDELKKRLSVQSLIWVIDLMDQLQNINAHLDSVSEGYGTDLVLEESKC
jgi:hypothetical protein